MLKGSLKTMEEVTDSSEGRRKGGQFEVASNPKIRFAHLCLPRFEGFSGLEIWKKP